MSPFERVEVRWHLPDVPLQVGLIHVDGVGAAEADEALRRKVDDCILRRQGDTFPPDEVRRSVRDVLRQGGFKPTGRNKPASEYLVQCARRGAFPRINGIVDAANLLSLRTGWPVSLLDLDRALQGAGALEIRAGRPEESYVFNPSGQSIALAGLPLIARGGGVALGNAVKDSMTSKTDETTRRVLAVLWVPRALADRDAIEEEASTLANDLCRQGPAASSDAWTLGA